MSEPIILSLPVPPSVNSLFRNLPSGGRVRSTPYRKWATEAGLEVMAARQKPITGPVAIHIAVKPRKGADVDNKIKAIADLLVTHKLIEDDCWPILHEVRARWEPEQERCQVIVYSLAEAA